MVKLLTAKLVLESLVEGAAIFAILAGKMKTWVTRAILRFSGGLSNQKFPLLASPPLTQ